MDIFSDKLLVNLRILSKIPKNGRITRSIDGVISLEPSGYLVSVKRFLTADSRKQTLIEIDKILISCIAKFKEILQNNKDKEKTKELLLILHNEIKTSMYGLENLKTTYQDDQSMVSHLDIFLLKTETLLNEINDCIQTINSSNSHTPIPIPEVRIPL